LLAPMLAAAPPWRMSARTRTSTEDERAVALAADQVEFAAARMRATGDPIIARHQRDVRPARCRCAQARASAARPDAPDTDSPETIVALAPLSAAIIAQAAAAAAASQDFPAGTLYLVATPIGNLADITLRALHVLGLVDAVACEDTRVAGALLAHLGLAKPLIALHQHNERTAAVKVIERLAQGERVAYLSDAGTPAISDPGALLVEQVHRAGHRCVPLPGASSVTTALSVAGDAHAGGFAFVGFAPAKAAERRAWLQTLGQRPGESLVLFEAPHRIAPLLDAVAEALPARTLTIARELTKQFEQIATMTAADAPPWLAADANRARGEFVLVLHALAKVPALAGAIEPAAERTLGLLLAALPLKQAVALAAEISGAPRNHLYVRALALRDAP
jgi:16S rRNA (cytidine1402-2'-O)-methyltransferase